MHKNLIITRTRINTPTQTLIIIGMIWQVIGSRKYYSFHLDTLTKLSSKAKRLQTSKAASETLLANPT